MTSREAGLVSVILPTFQRVSMLSEAINSVLEQTYPQLELLVIDDGSTDGTSAMVEGLRGKDSRIRYFHQANAGPAKARSTGLSESRGEFIAFQDSDDLWHRDKLEKQIRIFHNHPEIDFVYCSGSFTERDGTPLPELTKLLKPSEIYTAESILLDSAKCLTPAIVIRAKCLDDPQIRYREDIHFMTDIDFYLKVLMNRRSFYLAEDLVTIRKHDSNLAFTKKETLFLEMARSNVTIRRSAVELFEKRVRPFTAEEKMLALGRHELELAKECLLHGFKDEGQQRLLDYRKNFGSSGLAYAALAHLPVALLRLSIKLKRKWRRAVGR